MKQGFLMCVCMLFGCGNSAYKHNDKVDKFELLFSSNGRREIIVSESFSSDTLYQWVLKSFSEDSICGFSKEFSLKYDFKLNSTRNITAKVYHRCLDSLSSFTIPLITSKLYLINGNRYKTTEYIGIDKIYHFLEEFYSDYSKYKDGFVPSIYIELSDVNNNFKLFLQNLSIAYTNYLTKIGFSLENLSEENLTEIKNKYPLNIVFELNNIWQAPRNPHR